MHFLGSAEGLYLLWLGCEGVPQIQFPLFVGEGEGHRG